MMKKRKRMPLAAVLLFILLLGACTAKKEGLPENIRVRLSAENKGNWGDEAVGFAQISKNNCVYTPKIFVLDTGCNAKSDKITAGYNAMGEPKNTADSDGHGTIVINKLLALIDCANVIPIKIANSEKILLKHLLAGLEQAISLRPDVISMSIGTAVDYPEISQKIREAVEHNIVVVAAAGNQGASELLFPAKYDGVISVLARDINNIDVASNNKSETKRSFSAPGVNIWVGGEYISGSSIAVPYVTAIVSQMIAAAGKAQLTVQEIENILSATALYPTKFSFGLAQYTRAVKETLKLS
jgi:subtilisin family serine protease